METAKKIVDYLNKALTYLRVQDEQARISLTNIAMIVVLYKMCVTPASSFQDITGLAIAILGYQAKRFIEKKDDQQ